MLPEISEIHADYVLSISKGGLYDMVTKVEIDEEKDCIVADLQPSLVEKFHNKFPETSLTELDNVVQWILIKAMLKNKEQEDVGSN